MATSSSKGMTTTESLGHDEATDTAPPPSPTPIADLGPFPDNNPVQPQSSEHPEGPGLGEGLVPHDLDAAHRNDDQAHEHSTQVNSAS